MTGKKKTLTFDSINERKAKQKPNQTDSQVSQKSENRKSYLTGRDETRSQNDILLAV